LKNVWIFDNPKEILTTCNLFRKTVVATLSLLRLNCLMRLNKI